jgi:hypothetical protein
MTPTPQLTGKIICGMAILAFAIDRLFGALSSALGRLLCGANYLLPVNGVVGDASCGFNADMVLSAFLVVALVGGLYLVIRRR